MSQPLRISCFLLVGSLLLFLVDGADVNLEVKGNLNLKSPLIANTNGTTNNLNEQKGVNYVSDSLVEKEGQVENPKEVIRKDFDKRNTSKPLEFKDDHNQKFSKENSTVELEMKDKERGKTGGSEEGFGSNEVPRKDGNEESSGSSTVLEKEKSHDEECDPSNMCVDEKKNLTACLRVPGNDSPDLSLLIQNKGTRPVIVTITAPASVQLEETKVQLQQKEDKKVKVSLAYEGIDSLIFLRTEDSRCTLDFRELIPHDSKTENRYAFKLRFLDSLTRTRWVIFLTLTAVLVFGSVLMYFGLRKEKLFPWNRYQALEMELPVSVAEKTVNDSWDDSWDDGWVDEEAPMSPTLPSTPSLSSRGLFPRRLGKEGWKD